MDSPRDGDPAIVQMPGLDGADTSSHPLGGLLGEPVLFHEYGHVLAYSLGIGSRSSWVIDELFANIFSSAYIQSERPDLHAFVESRRTSRPMPRYGALIDFDYLGEGTIDSTSVGWMQLETINIGFILTKSERLSDLVPKLKEEFTLSSGSFDRAEALIMRLRRISGGLASSFAALYGQTAIPLAKPVACDAMTSSGDRPGRLIIVNATANSITMNPLNDPNGPDHSPSQEANSAL